jgi:hypothetical protein
MYDPSVTLNENERIFDWLEWGFVLVTKVRGKKTGLSNLMPLYLHFLPRPTPPKRQNN